MKKVTNITKLLDLYPINLDEPSKANELMKEGIARIYSDNGARTYLENAVKLANMNVMKCLDNGETDKAQRFASRMETLLKLLLTGREQYVNYERIRNATKKGVIPEVSFTEYKETKI